MKKAKRFIAFLICLCIVVTALSGISLISSAFEVKTGFPDVNYNSWYGEAVSFCSSEGYITGYKNGNFGPTDKIQRQDFVIILARIAEADLSKVSSSAVSAVLSKFSDCNDADAYYVRALAWGVQNKVVSGYTDGRFGVGDPVTREQICVFMCRFLSFKGKSVVFTGNMKTVLMKFRDAGRVSGFAENAVAWCVDHRVISGTADGYLNPVKPALRCEIAQIIHNCCKGGLIDSWIDLD